MTIEALVFLILKILILVALVVYTIFAAVIFRQEQLMADVLEETFEPVLRILTTVHLMASLVLFFFAIVLL
ncbi:hypothetical protein HY031_02870 [Candidatus Gottesmanbacteria bacterium]|nr:hypothetical protein [Candidatus Gottesmanbacteria bacterium]